ncbi:hypothetical protein WL22_10175 [Burkholderia ubonensis]|uniref:Uncharacterized protein n=1 Tax=Burkholderia ubonensis TaxID=101571 RepID=A0ABD6Q6Y0_9BURK|nr:hypothetical protein WK51_17910 [Burkholderia ubonensis]KVZ74263.1 hypothetical protein WL22_10175 [Burkholderia ubonensis]OJA48738.1 hypothetical protein BGV66_08780 [Burkholderia ubonensis]
MILLPYAFNGCALGSVLKPSNVRRDFTEVGGPRLQVQSDDIQFLKARKPTTGRAYVIVDHVAIESQLQVGPDDVFADVSQHE